MKKKLIGLVASVAMLGAGAALANDQVGSKTKSQDVSGMSSQSSSSQDINQTRDQSTSGTSLGTSGSSIDNSGTGGSGAAGSSTGSMGTGSMGTGSMGTGSMGTGSMDQGTQKTHDKMMGQGSMQGSMQGTMGASEQMGNELTGRVVRSDPKMLYVNHMGFVVPLQINSQTKFEGTDLKSARDIKEGQEIRANFTIKNKTQNVATSVSSSSSGQGGSGILRNDTGDQGMRDQGSLGGRSDSVNQGTIDDRANQPSRRTMNPGPLNNNSGSTPDRTY